MAAPIPFAPPVTSTTLPLSSRFIGCRSSRGPDRVLAAQIEKTSVNRIVGTRDERCFFRAKIKSKGGDLIGLRHSSDGLRFFQLGKHRLFLTRIIAAQITIDKGRTHS